jgi:hypothetical protein
MSKIALNIVDKNGNEIFNDSILEVKLRVGDGYYSHAYYQVHTSLIRGISLQFLKLIPGEDENELYVNQLYHDLSFAYDSLAIEYDGDRRRERLVVPEKHGRNHLLQNSWIEHRQSSDILVSSMAMEDIKLQISAENEIASAA